MSNDPLPGGRITQSGGTAWIIDTAEKLQLVEKWECVCTKVPTVG
jgi:hypothetical protein